MITGKVLVARGWPQGKLIGLAKQAAAELSARGLDEDAILTELDAVRVTPGNGLRDEALAPLARAWLKQTEKALQPAEDEVRATPLAYETWGAELIDVEARKQMENALRLPVAVAGALMPDAHVGYALPIGGVLATANAVIPYGVGVDIACRMRLSIYPVAPYVIGQRQQAFKNALLNHTRFGKGAEWSVRERPEHAVLDDTDWQALPILRRLQNTAYAQLGTSGGGNHFCEWGALDLPQDDAELGLAAGHYLALLSHSGSRGVGFQIAQLYTKLAQEQHPSLKADLRQLAWLDLDRELGQEYWLAMNLAGRFAAANHEVMHRRVADAVGLKAVAVVENHHNFCFRESLPDGTTVYVHRKGATPAGAGVLGVIPGSMGDPGYVVRGRGSAAALNSASHGAGRQMGRKAALQSLSGRVWRDYLRERDVVLLGGSLDEAPQAYKPIEAVIAAQSDLVEVIARFSPRIVRMAEESSEF